MHSGVEVPAGHSAVEGPPGRSAVEGPVEPVDAEVVGGQVLHANQQSADHSVAAAAAEIVHMVCLLTTLQPRVEC